MTAIIAIAHILEDPYYYKHLKKWNKQEKNIGQLKQNQIYF
jgi:hypothetical protein